MRYLALACDYDGTLAELGRMDDATLAALRRVRESGRHIILLTGRRLTEVLEICPGHEIFSRVVAENGALLYDPVTRKEKLLAEPPPPTLLNALRARRIAPLAVGRVILATTEPHETAVLNAIRDLGIEWHVIFNKGSVMALPSGTNKASGLQAALAELGLSPHNCVGVGDAENDHAFLRLCECAVAVGNALPSLKEAADFVTDGDNGRGSRELIDRLVGSDLEDLAPSLTRHGVEVGVRDDGTEARIAPYGENVLVAGPSGSGKSTFTTGTLERLARLGYQYCIVDPEGDYATAEGAVVLGNSERPPAVGEILDVLRAPEQHAVVNLLGISVAERPAFFASLLPRLQELRSRVGRPHWIIIDEAHHLLPVTWTPSTLTLPRALTGTLMITVHPEFVSPAALGGVSVVVAVGADPGSVLHTFAAAAGHPAPPAPATVEPGRIVFWRPADDALPIVMHSIPPQGEHRRHVRKYAQGDLGEERSFYFRGPDGRLRLRAQNLSLFVQLADGVDDETWQHHLQRRDYSDWVREAIKDEELASEVAAIEAHPDRPPAESRALVRAAIERRYTSPA
jgi:hydroxymethylpyrimidine pyrophosphatase-like HAD family hydrolase